MVDSRNFNCHCCDQRHSRAILETKELFDENDCQDLRQNEHYLVRNVDDQTVESLQWCCNPDMIGQTKKENQRSHVFIEAPRNEAGQLGVELLIPFTSKLSRLTMAPWKGNVLIDLTDVVSIAPQFVQVFETFQRQLMKQQRNVILLIRAHAIRNPRSKDISKLILVHG